MKVTTSALKPQLGFSLIEIMAVMFIIVILLTFVVGAFGWVETSKRERTAQVFVQRISTGIEEFRMDNGFYPDGDGSETSTNAVYQALMGDYNDDGLPDKDPKTGVRNHVYVEEINPSQQSKSEPNVSKYKKKFCLIDPWGTPYRYRLGFQERSKDGKGDYGKGQNPDFDFWSLGQDGKGNLEDNKLGVNSDNIGNM
jgi:prepilin-type N-terminal cleavage/methylation domain-containing protein